MVSPNIRRFATSAQYGACPAGVPRASSEGDELTTADPAGPAPDGGRRDGRAEALAWFAGTPA